MRTPGGRRCRVVPLLVALIATTSGIDASPRQAVRPPPQISINPTFFNPTLGQGATIGAQLPANDIVSVSVLDPDGATVRKLVTNARLRRGRHSWRWDGRDDAGRVVEDEAYSLKIDFARGSSYFPAQLSAPEVAVGAGTFDAHRGVVTYQLPRASRVRVVASDGGEVSRVLVDWEPRVAGSVLEPWNGYDATGQVNLLSKPDSRITIDAKALCENALIVVGNRPSTYRNSRAGK